MRIALDSKPIEPASVTGGQAPISAQSAAKSKSAKPETDPTMDSFLSFLEAQMATHPEHIVRADAAQLARIAALVTSVKAG